MTTEILKFADFTFLCDANLPLAVCLEVSAVVSLTSFVWTTLLSLSKHKQWNKICFFNFFFYLDFRIYIMHTQKECIGPFGLRISQLNV